MDNTAKAVPDGFTDPTATPRDAQQHQLWQKANQEWWQNQPMRYDFSSPIDLEEFSMGFFYQIDSRFFEDAKTYMPWEKLPFESVIDYQELKNMDVLEIGIGNGSHAALLARRAKSFTGIDITEYAVKSTSVRFQRFALNGKILQMDAEKMDFPDASFDFVWSWGVIHHSADTPAIMREISRVLRPGGTAVTMVYHRSKWHYYVVGGLVNGIIRGRLFKYGSLHSVVQHQIDGAIARYYTVDEWRSMASKFMRIDETKIYGSKTELFPIPGGKIKRFIMALVPNSVTRFFTNKLGWGYFLVSRMTKN